MNDWKGIRRILIVEDVPEVREWLAESLRRECPAVDVETVQSSSEFLDRATRHRPDLVLLDEILGPGEDLAGLLQVAETMTLNVVLMSGMMTVGASSGRDLPGSVLARIQKPSWETGKGMGRFLAELRRAWALTGGAREG